MKFKYSQQTTLEPHPIMDSSNLKLYHLSYLTKLSMIQTLLSATFLLLHLPLISEE